MSAADENDRAEAARGAHAAGGGRPGAGFVRRHLTTIVLVVLAAAGAVKVLVLDRDSVTTNEAEYRKRNLVPMWRPDDIRTVTLTAHGKTARVVRGEPTEAGQRLWEVEIDGGRFLASQQMVDQLLGTLEYATFERAVSRDAVSAAELGLGSPETVVTVEMGSSTYRLAVGGQAPTPKDARYCEAPGGTYVITAQLAAALALEPDALRTRTFVPYVSTELTGLLLDGEGGARHFERAPWSGSRGAGFRFDGSTPEGAVRADAEVLDRLLGALGSMQAESFLADADADRALVKRVTVTMAPKDAAQPRAVIEVGGACPGKEGQIVAVRRAPSRTSACVPDTVMEALARPAADFVDLAVIGARADEVSELAIEQGERRIEIARADMGWHMRKPSDRKVSLRAGNALLEGLTKLAADRIATGSPKELGLDPPAATLRAVSNPMVLGADPGAVERIETIEIGAPQGDVVHARRLEDGVILAFPASKLAALLPDAVTLRDLDVLDLARADVRSLSVTAGARAQRLVRGAEGWSFAETKVKGLAPDVALVDDLIDTLVTLKALRWVAPKDDGSFGLERPRFVLEMKVAKDEGTPGKDVRVEIGAPTAEGAFARLGDDPAVFVAPRQLEEAADLWLFNRQALLVDEGALARVEAVSDAGTHLVAERAGDAWMSGSGAQAAAALRSAVTGLVSEGVVAIGPPDRSFGLEKPRLVLAVLAEPELGAPKGAPRRKWKIAFGAGDTFRGTSVVYVRRDDVDATFAVALGKVRALFDATGVK